MNNIVIGNKVIGVTQPLYFIADIGANHNGDLNRALRLIELAKEAGADAAKFQNFLAHKIVSERGFNDLGVQLTHQAKWKKSVYQTYVDASISKDWTPILKQKCDEVGIDYFTSPYDIESIDDVDKYVDIYKIGSGDISWIEILKYIASKKKPVILATGASDITDVDRAMVALKETTNDIVIMQCNTNYTVDKEKIKYVNLNVINTYAQRYPGVVLGLSDHTIGHATVLGAIALGAVFIEKHFTDDNSNEGPDHKFAMNPKTWREMVDNSYDLINAMGDGIKRIEENEKESIIVQRRAIRAKTPLNVGDIITNENVIYLRPIPKNGLAPYEISNILGMKVSKYIGEGEHITLENLQ